MKKFLLISLIVLNIFSFGIKKVAADDAGSGIMQKLDTAAGMAQYNESTANDLPTVVGRFINFLLSLLGAIFVILMLYAGFLWMTAQGKADQVDKAETILQNAIIGIVIVVGAYAITYFVLYALRAYTKNSGF